MGGWWAGGVGRYSVGGDGVLSGRTIVRMGWRSCVMLALVVDDELFRLALWVSLVVVGLLSWMALLIRVFAGGWLLDGALSSVFVRRWRIYCMMLVDGFRGFVGLGCWFVCVAAE